MAHERHDSQVNPEHDFGATTPPHSFPKFNPETAPTDTPGSHEFNPFMMHPSEKQGVDAAGGPPTRQWTPIPLRPWFANSLLTFMVLVGVALQIALHFSNVKHGWHVSGALSATSGILHYVYTLPPVAVAMIIVAFWTWTDVDIKKMQPYIDLAYGNAPASTTMLLDYSNKHPAIVSVSAWRHSHYIVALSSLMVLVGLAIQPLAASLFTVRDTWTSTPNITVTTQQALGLNPTFNNLTAFSTAAGFVQANVFYNVTPPNFVNGVWAIAAIQVPSDKVGNGTMFANSPSVRSTAHCKAGETGSIVPFTNNTGFTVSGTSDGCNVSIPVPTTATTEYGADIVTCPNSQVSDEFKPVVFWTLTRQGLDSSATPLFSLVYCTPTIELLNSAAQIALQTGNLQNASITTTFNETNNITDPNGFMKGLPFNGIAFDLAGADPFAQNRAQASKTGLTAAIIQKAQQSPGGLSNQIQTFGMVGLTESVYTLYLSLVARDIYFVPSLGSQEVGIKTFQAKVWMVGTTVHIMTAVLFAFAALGGGIHILHRRLRDLVVLPRRPGTLASAAAFTAGSNISDILDGRLDEAALTRVLEHKRFRIDKITGRIVMEGDEGYESGEALLNPRKSILMQLRDRIV